MLRRRGGAERGFLTNLSTAPLSKMRSELLSWVLRERCSSAYCERVYLLERGFEKALRGLPAAYLYVGRGKSENITAGAPFCEAQTYITPDCISLFRLTNWF